MVAKILVPSLGESVTEATIAKWYKKPGENVKVDELIVELETEKVTLEVNSPASGALSDILFAEGSIVKVGDIIGNVTEGAAGTSSTTPQNTINPLEVSKNNGETHSAISAPILAPSALKIATESGINPANIQGSGKDGRITKGDVLNAISSNPSVNSIGLRSEERVKMTRLRKTIAQRLKDSQNTAAILTTFNEIDMYNVINLRNKYKEQFEKKHGIKLGFMSFFVKATINALREIPAVNAEIDGDDIIYKNYYDIGVAVGTEQGLVVPVVRDADKLSFAETERSIADLGKRARAGKLSMSELTGGTFSITNGGVYGSLMSTPIINPPQSGILGMHKTMDRAVVVGGQVVVRPMMYVALSYDHRMIDGKEAVTFLVKVKEAVEDPERLLLDL
jgi:2-oxoglutarate dehydrogenase E2 component (dihydrolipoamide succinyltransferase)